MAKSELSRWCGGGSLIINVENFVNFQNIINNDYFVRHMVTDVPPDLFLCWSYRKNFKANSVHPINFPSDLRSFFLTSLGRFLMKK